jgi:glutamate decarboxylase
MEAYEDVQRASNRIARHIAQQIAEISAYELITDGSDLPVVAFTLAPSVTTYTVFDVSARLRENGRLVPAYTFPKNREDLSVLRVAVRAGLTTDMADLFLTDLRKQTGLLESLDGPLPDRRPEERHSFKH